MDHQVDSCRASTWQATIPSLTRNLADKWQESADASIRSCQQAPKKLTTEALLVMCLILIFVMLNVIGSSINAYESFRKAFPRKKNSGKVKDSKNDAKRETQAESKMNSIESSSISVWRENCRKFFDCFCVQANARKILGVVSKQENMDCIDGIRALFFLSIFAVHFSFFYFASIKNLEKHIHVLLEMPITQISAHALFVIDAFFVLR
ncbi:hypothetical protein AVEN_55069-1 [Araneus ventricosus]|uniref:Uncharacterized protein n=1 Tax=Araneus ventricosus TaxID=182803 RepID=A0A4Y2GWD0_ARAVE|nr:hypothetical protein AVEN_55069-1 [Araneus ventricosus]